ncbi:flagellar motor switch protein FliN/FliY [Kineococcus xinjiangensis]|uniref:Flagellar motor switch protein FliN/FliY n=1 Tax=Kineococcus xinjiangensis TaxID=512762 RepID=A0A2S6IK20_9ACTN|nr:flagellar motor switch protein FliN [Kineococcus xinjiangensis]PPK94525.1 flagellar motor switch protein FliN/FliY [Kineococcus xinjiangensis]
MSTAVSTDARTYVSQAAEAALSVLPLSAPGSITDVVPASAAPDLGDEATAVSARFAGAYNGTVVVVIGEETLNALLTSPVGALDPVDALRPALETAVATLGGCTLEAGVEREPAEAMAALQGAGGAVAVVDAAGETLALIGLAMTTEPAARAASTPVPAAGAPVASSTGAPRTMDLLRDVQMDVTVELGRTHMTVRDLLALTPGSVVELDRAAGSPADILVNGQLVARGEVVVVDEDYAIRVTEIVVPGAEPIS